MADANPGPMSTRRESVEDIRQALQERRAAVPAEEPPASDDDTRAFRPFHRPPMATLVIFDDGQDTGEWVRIRADRLVIGRSEGDVRILHDRMMSSHHAELVRWLDQGRFRWRLTDLGSTNGTFVRLNTVPLKPGQEVLLGSHRFRFHSGTTTVAEPATPESTTGTAGWVPVSAEELYPALVELTPQGEGRRFPIRQDEVWIGRDSACALAIADDPLLSPRHARLHRDGKGRWHLTNHQSRNGVWLRVDEVAIDTSCHFQLGEQRFLMRVL